MNLPVVSCAEMRRIEEQTFAGGATAGALMEQVGLQIANAVTQYARRPGLATVYYGKGHNGGDALVAARWLAAAGWEIEVRPLEADPARLAPLTREKLAQVPAGVAAPKLGLRPSVILDGLLGIGATGALRDDVRAMTREINARRLHSGARVFAVDLPTGLNADTGEADPDCVVADFTVTAGFAKTGLVADGAANHVGRLCVAALAEFEPHAPREAATGVTTPASLRGILPPRKFDSHKNQYGRVGIVAGSPGFTGAAVMSASGALRGGAGLVVLYAPEEIQHILAVAAPPEVMVRPVKSYAEVLGEKHDVLAVGPGLGKARAGAILQLIEDADCPMVLDADGLNIVAGHDVTLLDRCAGPRLLTPHPGEMARLFPEARKLTRLDTATRFTAGRAGARFAVTLLLKGSRTIVHQHGVPAAFNTTGNPGMATGGMGDVLTGVCAALIGQHLSPYDAARTGAWICGRAAELACCSDESLAAMDAVSSLGHAFRQLRAGCL